MSYSNVSLIDPAQSSLPDEYRTTIYHTAELSFRRLIRNGNLDNTLLARPEVAAEFEEALHDAIKAAFSSDDHQDDFAHLFLQRVLYLLHRRNFFWFDDLSNYDNENSRYLFELRILINQAWEEWELSQLDLVDLQAADPAETLRNWAQIDLDPMPAYAAQYIAGNCTIEGYKKLLMIASLDGLVEASQLSRTLGGTANEIQAVLTKVFLEEYGNGVLHRKHSTYFESMLRAMGMNTDPEAYFEIVPWQVLAAINMTFLLSERKRYYLRYVGGLTYYEISVPSAFRSYVAAAKRLGIEAAGYRYWDLHVVEDERHGQWMLEQVAIPLMLRYPNYGWELLLGYQLQRRLSSRASDAVLRTMQKDDCKNQE